MHTTEIQSKGVAYIFGLKWNSGAYSILIDKPIGKSSTDPDIVKKEKNIYICVCVCARAHIYMHTHTILFTLKSLGSEFMLFYYKSMAIECSCQQVSVSEHICYFSILSVLLKISDYIYLKYDYKVSLKKPTYPGQLGNLLWSTYVNFKILCIPSNSDTRSNFFFFK